MWSAAYRVVVLLSFPSLCVRRHYTAIANDEFVLRWHDIDGNGARFSNYAMFPSAAGHPPYNPYEILYLG